MVVRYLKILLFLLALCLCFTLRLQASDRTAKPYWMFKIHVTLADVTFPLELGTMLDNGVKEGFDLVGDRHTAPPGFSAYASFRISDIPYYLTRDMRPITLPADRHEWEIYVLHSGPSAIQVSWNIGLLPDAYDFFIYTDHVATDMRQHNQIEFFKGQEVRIVSRSRAVAEYRFEKPGWHLISLPLWVDDSYVPNLFPHENYGSLYTWDPQKNIYLETDSLKTGQGYWIYVEKPFSASVEGVPVFHHRGIFHKGWNMLGAIYHEDLHINDLIIEPAHVYQSLMWWNPDLLTYEDHTTFFKGAGYWVLAFEDCQWLLDPERSFSVPQTLSMHNFSSELFSPPPPPGIFTSVAENGENNDWATGLEVYPNPFRQEVTLTYHLTDQREVYLTIYNLQGQVIRTLYKGIQLPGRQEWLWNARDENGRSVPSGLYLFCVNLGKGQALWQRALCVH
ncbi:T9SS type A sorting domain-containing protein [candidate division KSB1 bacterium]|nr:T9SS type A sorting domain-containing protein [candidate division KSB1 bacterium]